VSLQQVAAGGQVVRRYRQVRNGRMEVRVSGAGAGRYGLQAVDGACQGKPGGDDRRPGFAFRIGRRAKLIGQISQQPRYRRGHPADLVNGRALHIIGQLTVKLGGCGDMPARCSEEVTSDGRDRHRVISWQIRPAALAASWHAA
jgi:hypothetical protein